MGDGMSVVGLIERSCWPCDGCLVVVRGRKQANNRDVE
jgi:hypothetical protein